MHKKIKIFLSLFSICRLLLFLIFISCKTPGLNHRDNSGFVQIFENKTLNGWKGDPPYWREEYGNNHYPVQNNENTEEQLWHIVDKK